MGYNLTAPTIEQRLDAIIMLLESEAVQNNKHRMGVEAKQDVTRALELTKELHSEAAATQSFRDAVKEMVRRK